MNRSNQQSFRSLENKTYRVRLTEINEGKGNFDQDIFIFGFEIVAPSQPVGFKINSWITMSWHSQSKLIQAIYALMGDDYEIDLLNLTPLIGKECEVEIRRDTHINKIVRFKHVEQFEQYEQKKLM